MNAVSPDPAVLVALPAAGRERAVRQLLAQHVNDLQLFDAIVCDVMMPRLNGRDLFEKARARRQGLDRTEHLRRRYYRYAH